MNRAQRRKQQKEVERQPVDQNINRALELGMAHQAKGELAPAEQIYRQILAHQPDNVDALQLLGAIASQVQSYDQAIDLMKRSLALKPNQPNVWYNLARTYYLCGDMAQAIAANSKAIAFNPKHEEAYYNRGNVRTQIRDYGNAIADYKEALRLNPNHVDAGRNMALTYKEMQDYDACIAQFESMLKRHPNDAQLYRSLGLTMRDIGDVAKAQEYLSKAVQLTPQDCEIRYNLGLVKKFGEQDRADMQQMETMAQQPDLTPRDGVYLHFTLGKAYDTLGDYRQAFAHYDKGNALVRATHDYDTQRVKTYFERIKTIFTPELIAQKSSPEPKSSPFTPIFILGMPRSGSTLVEQILSSHTQLVGAGEQDDLHYLVTGNPWEKRADYLDVVGNMTPQQFLDMGQTYMTQMARFGDAVFISDKMPRNFHFVGMIKLMLPHAKVIDCRRHPLDTCTSIYKHLFFGHHPYAYNQTEVAQHYQLYTDLMTHWDHAMPGFVYQSCYETLVENPQEEIRRMLEFCGLPWQDACLNFHDSDRSVRTASANQVRQPLYKDAMQSWKRYADYITPMIDVLGYSNNDNL